MTATDPATNGHEAAGKLDAFKADFKAGKPPYNVPPEIHPIMERATRELIASGLAQRTLKAGDR